MATPRLTLGAILGTVSSTAHALTGSVDMVNSFVNMGQQRVAYMADEQKFKLTLERETMADTSLNNHVMAMTSHYEEVAKFRNATPERAEHFDKAYAKAQAALAKAFPETK